MFQKVYVIEGGRSYTGIENGIYRHMPAEEIGAKTLQQIIKRMDAHGTKLVPDGVILGNAVGSGGNIARLMALSAGLSQKIPAVTVDTQCSSGLTAIGMAAQQIETGMGDVYVAGGFESCSTAPVRSYNKNHPAYKNLTEKNRTYKVAKFAPGEHSEFAMLMGAEKTAVKYKMTDEEINRWVLRSHERAEEAQRSGVLSDIIFEITKNGSRDEGIRHRMSERLLNYLSPAVPGGHIITAGNSCLTNDGAAFLILASESYVKAHDIKPACRILNICDTAGDPSMSPVMAIKACERLLQCSGMAAEDIDIYECNEAFAVIDVLFERKWPELTDRYNIFGGALAYGHPFGATGGIISLHAMKALEHTGGRYGICSIAAAGGLGTAMLIERCE